MLFNSVDFLFVFLPVAVAVYYFLGKFDGIASRLWLCLLSFVFYGWLNPALLFILGASIVFNYSISLLIGYFSGKSRWQSACLFIGVAGNLGALFYYKYAVWAFSLLSGIGLPVGPLGEIILPLGISFFTFTQIGYLIDCKDGVAKERGPVNYVLFVTFFPHLIAGPILHHREMMPQFADQSINKFDARNFGVGLTIFLCGLFKKTIIADGVAHIADAGFAQTGQIGIAAAWISTLAYVVQLYFDFSGYSDMAIGLARMFNIRFPINFNSPYKARNIADFWQRWHMTLTRYLNAYLYNPVSMGLTRHVMNSASNEVKNPLATPKGFLLTVAVPTFWTMILAGLWHGAGGKYLIFGILHASYIVIYRAWSPWGSKLSKSVSTPWIRRGGMFAATALTLLCVVIGNVFFRSHTTADAFHLLEGMVGLHGGNIWAGTGAFANIWLEILLVVGMLAFIWTMPNIYQIMGTDSPVIGKVKALSHKWMLWQPDVKWAVATGLIGAAAIIAIGGASAFLYFQF